MPVEWISVLMPVATCDVCGEKTTNAYMTIREEMDGEPPTEPGPDPRVKVTLCHLHSQMNPAAYLDATQ